MNLGTLYAGINESIRSSDTNAIKLINRGNIPIQFQWDEKWIPDRITATFEPGRGIIPPHSE
mgnify:CR=1 FL=1